MHVAVEKGAPEGESFQAYVKYLADQHFLPPGGERWVDYIRERANDASHQIILMSKDDAMALLSLVERLFVFVYEMNSLVPGTTP